MISIIIPFYDQYLLFFDDCYKSVLNQSYDDYECIIVSTKDESKLLRKSYFYDPHFKLCISQNKDQSSKRNCGIMMAEGKYIVFLDCDDMYDPHFLETWNKIEKDCNPDLAIFGFTRTQEQCGKMVDHNWHYVIGNQKCIKNVYSFVSNDESALNGWYDSSCSKVFKRDIIINNDVSFLNGMQCAEDSLFVREYALHINTMYLFDGYKAYYWRINKQSTMFDFNSGFYNINPYIQKMAVISKQTGFFNKTSYSKYASSIFGDRFLKLLNAYYSNDISLEKLLSILLNYKNADAVKDYVSYKYLYGNMMKIILFSVKTNIYFPLRFLLKRAKKRYLIKG